MAKNNSLTTALLHFPGNGNQKMQKITETLRKEVGDIQVVDSPDFEEGQPSGVRILLLEDIDQRHLDLLRKASVNGLERVLVIAIVDSVLPDDAIWCLLQAGASDVFAWNHSTNPGREVMHRIERWNAVDQLVHSPLVKENLIGQSPAWISVLRQIVEVAYFTDANILITGETGTGKELIARLVHTLDTRNQKQDLVVLDCTTIVPDLSGSEFFGHERGAFTGAVSARDGAFALANGGTLFLDEVGELPMGLQAKLLRVVQEHTYKRVGGNTWQSTDFRLVCATNRELLQEIKQNRFRSDFYYRIANWTCKLPSLHDRTGDIIPLANHFMKQLRPGMEPLELDEPVRKYLIKRAYPGNVRDLRQLMCRIIYRHVGNGPITVGDIPEEERPGVDSQSADWHDKQLQHAIRRAVTQEIGLKEIRRAVEDIAVSIVLNDENGNLQRAAPKLGISDRALQMRLAARRQNKQTDAFDEME